ncbi:flagellar export chaperone FlgN [Edaphovirga cremea]|uniref:flagellar export chaperone FlgN n=1 Tax=Edaphovirga cremea TaxID=2267246 RepID=UPI000DEF2BDC|nr:flagellar export chaperone FlgN [Edaphovirga cremea]
MPSLAEALNALLETLNALDSTVNAEQTLLCSGLVNGVALQRITEQKSSLLTTLDYQNQQRQLAEKEQRVSAPYAAQRSLVPLWQEIQRLTATLNQRNQHNGLLLEQQIIRNSEALTVLNTRVGQNTLYGPNGQSRGAGIPGRKISI